ncbi:hypothetical protein [Teichococcus aestuarii]|uniref:hypothetical protein n=1 Tax=Teichococcus aestuarii TaxID=568898 RepID=UPI003621DF8A
MREKEAPVQTDRLRHEIDSGRTGDKVAFHDPAAAPLGADDEAAGVSPTLEQVAQARRLETQQPGNAVGLARGGSIEQTVGPGSRSRLGLALIGGGVAVLVLVALALIIG